jgi:hypothetical protein
MRWWRPLQSCVSALHPPWVLGLDLLTASRYTHTTCTLTACPNVDERPSWVVWVHMCTLVAPQTHAHRRMLLPPGTRMTMLCMGFNRLLSWRARGFSLLRLCGGQRGRSYDVCTALFLHVAVTLENIVVSQQRLRRAAPS